jgi:hypothetical protein
MAAAPSRGLTSRTQQHHKGALVELRGLEPLTFSLRRLRLAEDCARCGRLLVHYVHPDHGHDVTGAHMEHTVRIDSWAVALAARSRRSVRHDRTIGRPIQKSGRRIRYRREPQTTTGPQGSIS